MIVLSTDRRPLVPPPLPLDSFGRRLKSRREKLGLSQGDLATRAGLHRITISRYECDQGVPDAPTLALLARICGTTMDHLWGGEAAS